MILFTILCCGRALLTRASSSTGPPLDPPGIVEQALCGQSNSTLDPPQSKVRSQASTHLAQRLLTRMDEGCGMLRRSPCSGNYVVVFDPLDGSSNIDAGVSTGSIYGIYQASTSCLVDDKVEEACIVNVCQPGNALMAAGYCMYSSSCIMVRTPHPHSLTTLTPQHPRAADVAATVSPPQFLSGGRYVWAWIETCLPCPPPESSSCPPKGTTKVWRRNCVRGTGSLFRAAEFAVWEGVQQLRMSSLHQREHSLGQLTVSERVSAQMGGFASFRPETPCSRRKEQVSRGGSTDRLSV